MRTRENGLLRLIAIFKLFKAMTLIAVGLAALHLVHTNDPASALSLLAERLGLTPMGRHLDHGLAKLANLPPSDFRKFGVGSFVYAGLFLTEAIGLWLRKLWGEWVTTIITGSLVPFEVLEIHRHLTPVKIVLLLLNVAIVVYLVLRIRSQRKKSA